jgi:cobalt-zinc-cadmium efflux system outer membrane protein
MRARPILAPGVIALAVTLAASVHAQTPTSPPAPNLKLTLEDAVRLALEHNETLRALRLTIDESKADEVTADLKPNPTLSLGADGFTVFSPRQMNWSFLGNSVNYGAAVDYLFERGNKRENRLATAKDTTDVTAKTVADNERQIRFQTEQAFVNVQLAKTTLDLAEQDLKSFSDTVTTSQARVAAGDLAEGDFLMISLQKLQFEQDETGAELGVVQSKAALRQLLGYDTVGDDFDVVGDLAHTKIAVTLDGLKTVALGSRPDLQAATSGVQLAVDQAALEVSNRARDIDGSVNYNRNAYGPVSTLGVAVSFDLQIHDQNQGNIAHTKIAIDQAKAVEAATRTTVLTDVVSAFAQYQTNEKVLALYESGYLDQAKQSLDISSYVFQRGAGTVLDLLDAERQYRATQLAYRQALAAYVTSVYQLNFVVGKQVTP